MCRANHTEELRKNVDMIAPAVDAWMISMRRYLPATDRGLLVGGGKGARAAQDQLENALHGRPRLLSMV